MTGPVFKKGDKIALIKSWDNKGTFYIRRGTVTSWGKKVGRIMLENGKMLNEAIQTYRNLDSQKVVPDASDFLLEVIAIEDADKFLTQERKRLSASLQSSENENFRNAIRMDIDALHESRVKWA